MYEQACRTVSDSARNVIYRRMDSTMMAEAPVVVLYYDQVLRFIGKEVENMENNAMNLLTLKRVRKSQH